MLFYEKERKMKYWEIIADNLSKAGWSWGLHLSRRFSAVPVGE